MRKYENLHRNRQDIIMWKVCATKFASGCKRRLGKMQFQVQPKRGNL